MKKLFLLLIIISFSSFGQFRTPEYYGYPTLLAHAAIQRALDSTGHCELLPHVYTLTSSVYINNYNWLIGEGATLSYGANVKMLIIQGNVIRLKYFMILGGGIGTEQYGIYLNSTTRTGYYDIQVEGVKFKDLASSAIYVHNNVPVNFRAGIIADRCVSLGCDTAYYLDERAEYNFFSNCHASEGTVGFYNRGGNNSLLGGSLNYNSIGFFLDGGDNDGHSVATGVTVNHNKYAVVSDSLENGYVFNGCHFNIGNFDIKNSKGITFNSGSIYADTIKNSSIGTFFTSVDFSKTPNFIGSLPCFSNNKFVVSPPPGYVEIMRYDQAIKSPDGTIYRIKVDNCGKLYAQEL